MRSQSLIGQSGTSCLVILAALVLAGINGAFFTTGYWLNADDVMFLQFALEGRGAVLEASDFYARHQGRIGHYVLVPMNALGAGLADHAAFRILYVGAFFFWMFLFVRWFAAVSGFRITAPAFLLVAALTPLHFYHLSPTSYPLQNTVPFILLITARLWIVRGREQSQKRHLLWIFALFSLAMAISEYAFLLGTGMLAVEYLLRFYRAGSSHWGSIIRSAPFREDLIVSLAAFALIISFRIWFPSTYDGNALDGLANPALALKVWFLHAFGLNGLVFAQGFEVFEPTWLRFWLPLLAGLTTGSLVYLSVPQLADSRKPLVPGLLALVFAFYVTFPASMTEKQQQWCAELGSCIFLDSRSAFPATILALALLMAFIAGVARSRPGWALMMRVLMALGIAGATLYTFSHNAWMSQHMASRMAVWSYADTIACSANLPEENFQAFADPDGVIAIHPHLDAERFWQLYISRARQSC